ncbi:hypothetical protein OESDEN_17683 [Oesophagostomum dentatum]|uniref:CWH43-like N-terminal domain-containing protein n=1 Tax=Oesophagostomum dentatum TaxID=61180 RepID=A0A0B1SBH7_OESDE|nr:hypothetical protein OESDEN_17683 [Oesophagostomum dentatum]
MYVGLFASFGLTMVANFRENEIETVHGIAALIAFFGMVLYGWSQVIIG